MPECVVDTNILQKANAPLKSDPKTKRKFLRRLQLLQQVLDRHQTVLISQRLLTEYQSKIQEPRNDYVRLFLEILTHPAGAVWNWHSPWTGGRQKARDCRFPAHDDHVLRTAIRPNDSTIFTEELPMLKLDKCLHQKFGVHVRDL